VALAPSERSYRDRLFLLAHQVGGGREEGVVIDLRDRVPQHPAPEPITPFGGIGPPD
jgi:hypothetical protein